MANRLSRRKVMGILGATGIGSATFHRAIAAGFQDDGKVTKEMIEQAEWISGIDLSDDQRSEVASALNRYVNSWRQLRSIPLENAVPPALVFEPTADELSDPRANQVSWSEQFPPQPPSDNHELAFLPVSELAALVRSRQVSARELTKLYLDRLVKFDPLLKCVVTLTEQLALAQAERMDRELAAGRYRGPLHGIPWGAKDLISYPGYPTTWGAPPYKEQKLETKATVAARLEQAGAVLLAKLSLGALAQGDKWFGGMTRNPWNPKQGSSGSSAGSASATAAGLVGFTLGSETLGSIVSPCRRCGPTGLRPSFGRVSRAGCMALSWSMDKIGPIARSVEDCAMIFAQIHGNDGLDASAVSRPFSWPYRGRLKDLRVGYFQGRTPPEERADLQVLRDIGVRLVPIELPREYPAGALTVILTVEAATAFDELTRKGITEGLNSWPRTFRRGQFVPAVEYLRANRVRTLLMASMNKLMKKVDLYVGGNDLTITNLTGHPCVVLPNGFREVQGRRVPFSITFTGRLYGETELLAVAHAYQQATGHHLERPPLDQFLREQEAEEKNAADPDAKVGQAS